MDWYAKDVRAMRAAEYLRLPADLRGHHDALLALLAERERGPVLHGAREWTRRDWDRACACTPAVISRLVSVQLATWCGDDLHVAGFDVRGEELVKRARALGLKGAEARWSKHRDPISQPISDPNADPSSEPTRPANAHTRTVQDETGQDEPRARKRAQPTPGMQAAIAAFDGAYRERTGGPPHWSARTVAMLKPLVRSHGADEVCRRIAILFSDPPRFLASSTPDVGTLVQHFDKLAGPARPRAVASPGDELRAAAESLRLKGL